jgi:hypothetical protein
MTPANIPTPYVTSIHACDFAANCIIRTLDIELKPWQIPCVQIRCGGIKTASSLTSTSISKALQMHPRIALYSERLTKWSKEISAFDQKRTEPAKVAQVVLNSLRATHPKRRYSVGYMVGAATFLESLPQPLADVILKMRF